MQRKPRKRRGAGGSRKKGAAPDPGLTDQLKARLFDLRKAGFNRFTRRARCLSFPLRSRCWTFDFDQPVFMLVDRLAVSAESRSRIVDAVETAYREAGEVIFELPARVDSLASADEGVRATRVLRFAQRFECKNCNLRYEEPEPRLFSFNNPYGACPRCQGFGNTIDFDLDLVIPDQTKTLGEGAIDPWNKPKYRPLFADMKRFAKQVGHSAGRAMGRAWRGKP